MRLCFDYLRIRFASVPFTLLGMIALSVGTCLPQLRELIPLPESALGESSARSNPIPELDFAKQTIRREVQEGTGAIEFVYSFRNRSDQSLSIDDERHSCACSTVSIELEGRPYNSAKRRCHKFLLFVSVRRGANGSGSTPAPARRVPWRAGRRSPNCRRPEANARSASKAGRVPPSRSSPGGSSRPAARRDSRKRPRGRGAQPLSARRSRSSAPWLSLAARGRGRRGFESPARAARSACGRPRRPASRALRAGDARAPRRRAFARAGKSLALP